MNKLETPVKLALPKGRMENNVLGLLAGAGIQVRGADRSYRPGFSLPGFSVKMLRPQNILEMLHLGTRDLGFAGHDWVEELGVEVVELLDTGLDPVCVVAAAPASLADHLEGRPLVVASQYERLSRAWIARRGLDARFVRAWGATEVFPPEDADCIVDNSASGETLAANGLVIVDRLLTSSTRLYASKRALEDPALRSSIEHLVLLLRSVLEARSRVMLEVNVDAAHLEAVVAVLPCMREPTISPLHGQAGFAVKAAVPKAQLPSVIPLIRQAGGTDLVVSTVAQIVG